LRSLQIFDIFKYFYRCARIFEEVLRLFNSQSYTYDETNRLNCFLNSVLIQIIPTFQIIRPKFPQKNDVIKPRRKYMRAIGFTIKKRVIINNLLLESSYDFHSSVKISNIPALFGHPQKA